MKAAEDSASHKVSVYFCFKCKFFSPSQEHFDNHMTFLHLVPPQSVIGKFLALSTPNLLLITFLRTSEVECEEDDSSTKDDSNQDEDDNDNGSEISGKRHITYLLEMMNSKKLTEILMMLLWQHHQEEIL